MPRPARARSGRLEHPRGAPGNALRTGHLHLEPGHHRGHDRKQLRGRPFHRVRQDPGSRAGADGAAGGRERGGAARSHARDAGGHADGEGAGEPHLPATPAAGGFGQGAHRGTLSQAHAAGLGLQPGRVHQGPAVQSLAPGGGLRGHPCLCGGSKNATRAQAQAYRAGRDPLPRSPGCAGGVRSHSRDPPLRHGAHRQADPGPGPQQHRTVQAAGLRPGPHGGVRR